ncbi:MAG: hypothetical protein Q8O42_22685 [Acidobacteriota bacterium]|nr:hypothetical protein [Acidobacteriota bacterium]
MTARCTNSIKRTALGAGLAAAVTLMSVSVATAQSARDADGYRDAHRLGGTTSFYRPALTNHDSVKRMANTKGMGDDIRKVLRDSGIPETSNAVIAMLSSGLPVTVMASCADAAPADGVMVECDFQRGATLEWMAYRPNIGRGDRTPGRLEKFRWAGRESFDAFLFRVTDNNRIYTFVVPKECGNLSLMSVQEIKRETPPPPPPPAVVAPPPPPPPAVIAPPPPPPPVMVEAAPAIASVKASPFFFDVLAGKDRRVRPTDGRETVDGFAPFANAGPGEFAQCSPLLGFKLGMAKRFDNDMELAGAVGIALSLTREGTYVREHQVFADVELNKYVGGGSFIGTGVSLWDVTHSDTMTPAWMLHFGIPLTQAQKVYFVGQARMYLDNADDVKNNYLLWGGVRVKF